VTTTATPTERACADACHALARGGVVAYPTEAVFGLGCDPRQASAVTRLLALKERPAAKGLILIATDLHQLEPWIAPLSADVEARVTATWPGPVTWLLPAAADCPHHVRGDHDTLAARVTDHPVAAALCRAWGGALVSTSANVSGGEPARSAAEVETLFGDRVDHILPGPIGDLDRPTPIFDARTGKQRRA